MVSLLHVKVADLMPSRPEVLGILAIHIGRIDQREHRRKAVQDKCRLLE